ncbi:WBSCR27 [Branchiostoma lanceolatum]|uniref:WBSCR27 protein n=1 Tax=Branchiostoma lanceolatum TaxID=7740 RepID=A0A8K0ELX5_BRALA|nr:WBSCR27 [Branchiostoma lanceolatum]
MADTPEEIHHRLWHVLTPGIPREQSQELYRTWAPLYEQDMKTSQYKGPRQVAETLVKALGNRSDARVLDVAAGTGFVGEELQKMGFSNVDALDACQEMLDIAKTKQVYKNFILDFLGTNRLNIEDDTYDATSCCGAFCEGHVKCDCLEELVRVVKPGGFVCVGIRKFFLETVEEYRKLEPLMADLQRRGLWEPISRDVTQDYCEGYDGVVFLFKVK